MNPIFVLLVLLAGVVLWFGINSLFPKIGKLLCDLFGETKFNITNNNEEKE